ncbi:prolyl aminopeptidase [Mycoplasma sp. CSL10137]|uniref:prolyl aminopeptidase n=1 Tax=unclassified Mycoplasma TaxID=2683645 RepID=UPI00197C75AD|nr:MULTISPECIES: prolyl aminopeptidase [unclassified Mycoplasma]MBN4083807.1 prolyl aminopeptidase [Mycoplasma sp. CSL10137]MBN4084243.1 prolyl aminopeptidase [Mycoplasma sp. CSL10166]
MKIETNKSYFLNVSSLHKIHYKIYGNLKGKPVFVVHGGPGGGSHYKLLELFDQNKFMIIFMDQRGCGLSTPFLELQENNTNELVDDIEKLRNHLQLGKIMLFGGSWGTTLSLMYALKYTNNVSQILLRAVFLGRQEDVDYLYEENGASDFYPDLYEEYKNIILKYPGKNNLEKYYYALKNEVDINKLNKVATTFSNWESALVSIKTFVPLANLTQDQIDNNRAIALMETHYFVNKSFLESDNYILENAHKLSSIPTYIVHGRQDIDCRPIGAYLLHKKIKNSKLYLVDSASHSTSEPPIWNKIMEILKNI